MMNCPRTRLRRHVALLGLALCVAAPNAHAVVSCTIAALSSAAFGSYNPFSASNLDGVATATINCTSTKSSETATISVTASAGTSGSFASRQMQGPGANRLNYNLYIDVNRTQIFGTGASGTFADTGSTTVGSGSPSSLTETIYGRIPAGQDVGTGAYSDVLIYTVNF